MDASKAGRCLCGGETRSSTHGVPWVVVCVDAHCRSLSGRLSRPWVCGHRTVNHLLTARHFTSSSFDSFVERYAYGTRELLSSVACGALGVARAHSQLRWTIATRRYVWCCALSKRRLRHSGDVNRAKSGCVVSVAIVWTYRCPQISSGTNPAFSKDSNGVKIAADVLIRCSQSVHRAGCMRFHSMHL